MKTSLSIAALLLSSAALLAEEARAFEKKVAEGTTWVVQSKRILDFDLTVSDLEGQKADKKQVKTEIEETYERRVEKVEGGRPVRVRLTWTSDRRGQDPGPMQGKEVVLDATGGRLKVEGDLSPEQRAGLRIEEDYEAILPDRPIAVGAKWSLEHRDVARFVLEGFNIQPGAQGSATCELLSIESQGGRDLAKVKVDLDLSGDSASHWSLSASLTGTLTYDLTNGRPEALVLTGEMRASGKETDEKKQEAATVEGRGQVSIVNTYRPK